jgi:hypothetical protein
MTSRMIGRIRLVQEGGRRFISPQSGRLRVAQRFIAGIVGKTETKSVERTAEQSRESGPGFSRPFHGLRILQLSDPSSELLGYYHSSALRTDQTTCSGSPSHCTSPMLVQFVSRYPELYFGSIRGFSKQLGHGPVYDRVLKVRAKLSQWYEYKAAAI